MQENRLTQLKTAIDKIKAEKKLIEDSNIFLKLWRSFLYWLTGKAKTLLSLQQEDQRLIEELEKSRIAAERNERIIPVDKDISDFTKVSNAKSLVYRTDNALYKADNTYNKASKTKENFELNRNKELLIKNNIKREFIHSLLMEEIVKTLNNPQLKSAKYYACYGKNYRDGFIEVLNTSEQKDKIIALKSDLIDTKDDKELNGTLNEETMIDGIIAKLLMMDFDYRRANVILTRDPEDKTMLHLIDNGEAKILDFDAYYSGSMLPTLITSNLYIDNLGEKLKKRLENFPKEEFLKNIEKKLKGKLYMKANNEDKEQTKIKKILNAIKHNHDKLLTNWDRLFNDVKKLDAYRDCTFLSPQYQEEFTNYRNKLSKDEEYQQLSDEQKWDKYLNLKHDELVEKMRKDIDEGKIDGKLTWIKREDITKKCDAKKYIKIDIEKHSASPRLKDYFIR